MRVPSWEFDSPLRHHNKINGFGKYSIFSSPLFFCVQGLFGPTLAPQKNICSLLAFYTSPTAMGCAHVKRQPLQLQLTYPPQLSPCQPIRKGKGGLPRILSLAAERAKAWYKYPQKCPPLCSKNTRKTRSEINEAYQLVIETLIIHLDLASLCLEIPTLDNGFIDVDMKTIVRTSGIGQRSYERAVVQLKKLASWKLNKPARSTHKGIMLAVGQFV